MTNEERRQQVKAEKARRKKGDLKTKAVRYAAGCQIIKLEKKAFGWHYIGHTVDEDVSYSADTTYGDGYATTKIHKHVKIIKYAYFNRPKVWQGGFVLGLVETISNIVSFFRRLALNLIIVPIIITVVMMMGGGDSGAVLGLMWGGIYGGLIGLSLLLAALGFALKKAFKAEEKTDEILTQNGFDVWSANEEGETM
ncbi:MAG: hypothetical protein MJ228_05160 [Bacilli bacterium]|nr:hypothetical protein [Bacilli bacterium]